MSAVVLPLAPVRYAEVFNDFGVWRVLLNRRGQRPQRIGAYSSLEAAKRSAERVCRLQRIPSPPVIRPCSVLFDEVDA